MSRAVKGTIAKKTARKVEVTARAAAVPLQPAAVSAPTPLAASVKPAKHEVVRSFRIEQVLAEINANRDVLLAKQDGASLFSFLAFRGASPKSVATTLQTIPVQDRHVHSVFGRQGMKTDLALDLDFAHCDVAKTDKGYYTRDSVVLDTLSIISDIYTTKLQVPAPTDIVVLDGHSAKKHSVHIHVRSADGVFPDYRALKEIFAEVNQQLKVPAVDMGILRKYGMMRLAYTPKYNEPSRLLLPLKAADARLDKQLEFMHKHLTEVDIIERSLIVAPESTAKFFRGTASSTKSIGTDEFGYAVTPFMEDSKKWLRYKECCDAIKRYPLSVSEEYDTWIRVGLALHSFGNEDHIKDQWKNVSSRCRHKYNPVVCDKLWEKFSARPNCFNWRRGYNYLVGSLGKRYKAGKAE